MKEEFKESELKSIKEDEQASFGEIISLLIENHLVSVDQVEYAVRIQKKMSGNRILVETLKELEYVTDKQIKTILRANQLSLRIGDLLLGLGYLSEDKLNAAISNQKKHPEKRIGEIIIEKHFMSEAVFMEVLSVQLGLPFIDLTVEEIDMVVAKEAPIRLCQDYSFLPVRKKNGKVLIAFSDPFSKIDLAGARRMYEDNFIIGMASPRLIETKLGKISSGTLDDELVVDEETAIGMVDSFIAKAIDLGASDIHIEPFEERLQVRFRIDGILSPYKQFPINAANIIIDRIKVLCKINVSENKRHQVGAMEFIHKNNGYDIRSSFFVTIFGEKIVLQILNSIDGLIELENLGMPQQTFNRFTKNVLSVPSGVMIVTGPTGTGKTSTIYSCVSELNTQGINILTIEDPVEHVIEGVSQCSIFNQTGRSLNETLQVIESQDPDVVVISEIKDSVSANVAVNVALAGQKVITSFHAEDSVSGLIRLMTIGIDFFLVSSTISCILAQRLLRKICHHCIEDYIPNANDLKLLNYTAKNIEGYTFKKGVGCPKCNYTGYKGQLAVFELLILDEAIKAAILESKSSYELRNIVYKTSGFATLMEDALSKISKGMTTFEEAFRCVPRIIDSRPIHEINRVLGVR